MTTITVDRAVLEQVLEALEFHSCGDEIDEQIITALRAALAQQEQEQEQEQEPVAWTDRELELIDGMIEVQLRHAAQCDAIANRPMAERQKDWDMERVALLRKIRNSPPRCEWQAAVAAIARAEGEQK